MNEKIRCRYDADIIKGAMRSKEKGLKKPPVRYKSIANCIVSNNRKKNASLSLRLLSFFFKKKLKIFTNTDVDTTNRQIMIGI